MRTRKRIYDAILAEHLTRYRQMAFVSGPRQVGKTTTCRRHAHVSVNWDDLDDREQILRGPAALVERFKLDRLSETLPTALFDELHKFPRWKQFLKGFFDTYSDRLRIIVTGSSRMDSAELVDDLFHAVYEFGVLDGQAQVSAVADPVQGRAHDGATCS